MRFSQLQISKCLHVGHSKVRSWSPGRSDSIPTSNVAVPHTEQTGRTTTSECAVAGSKTITDPSHPPRLYAQRIRVTYLNLTIIDSECSHG